jgi:hypothetical protein
MNHIQEEHISRLLFLIALLSWSGALCRRRFGPNGSRVCLCVALCSAGVVAGWIAFLSAYRLMTFLAVYSSGLMSSGGFSAWAATASRLALPLWAFGLIVAGGYFGIRCWKLASAGAMTAATRDKHHSGSIIGRTGPE